jgi:hypothetical protein
MREHSLRGQVLATTILDSEASEGVIENQGAPHPCGRILVWLWELALIIGEPLHVCVSPCEDESVHEVAEPL